MEKSPKNLPYGISDYKTIVEDNLYYVDKTEYIEKLEKLHSYYVFFLRPRRFVKSLFTSVLENYYDIKEKDNFETLFANTYIGKHPTKNRNSYYVLKFNFSGLSTDTPEQLLESFRNKTIRYLNEFIQKQEAILQLGKYTQSAELMSLPGLKKWVLVFAGEKCIVNEEVR
jgi:hypothetical protein